MVIQLPKWAELTTTRYNVDIYSAKEKYASQRLRYTRCVKGVRELIFVSKVSKILGTPAVCFAPYRMEMTIKGCTRRYLQLGLLFSLNCFLCFQHFISHIIRLWLSSSSNFRPQRCVRENMSYGNFKTIENMMLAHVALLWEDHLSVGESLILMQQAKLYLK